MAQAGSVKAALPHPAHPRVTQAVGQHHQCLSSKLESRTMKKLTILVEIVSTIGAFASILWLFLDPGPEPFAASLVALFVILGIGVRAQMQLAKV
jgi:hypothetical protein